eukprot:scpid102281/ scgid21746/ 
MSQSASDPGGQRSNSKPGGPSTQQASQTGASSTATNSADPDAASGTSDFFDLKRSWGKAADIQPNQAHPAAHDYRYGNQRYHHGDVQYDSSYYAGMPSQQAAAAATAGTVGGYDEGLGLSAPQYQYSQARYGQQGAGRQYAATQHYYPQAGHLPSHGNTSYHQYPAGSAYHHQQQQQ